MKEKDVRDSYHCSKTIADGLANQDFRSIELGLGEVYDLFVDYLLEDRHDCLISLGRDLNAAYFSHRSKVASPFGKTISYLGQIRALINLCDYVTQRLIPEDLWRVVNRSKYSKPVIQALQKNGSMLATELCTQASLPHATQLQRTVRPLLDKGLIRREKFGKNVWYSLTSTGKLMTSRLFGIDDFNVVEAIFPEILSKLITGWQSLGELVDDVRVNIPIPALRSLTISIMSALHRIGITEEENGNWRISSEIHQKQRELVDMSNYSELMSATRLMEMAYEQSMIGSPPDKDSLGEARDILDSILAKIATSTEPNALLVKMTLEKAKCSALEGDLRTTFILVSEAETLAQTHDIDAGIFDTECRSVWPYVEAACLEPQLVQANDHIMRRDYSGTKDMLLTIHHLLTSSQRWNSGASLATKLLRIALDMAGAFQESQREYEHVIEETITQRQQISYEKEQAEACYRRWVPTEKSVYRMMFAPPR